MKMSEQRALGVTAPKQRGALADDVAAYIRELILTGQLKPGTRVDQDGIGEAMGVSRSPIREAIVVLGQEGLLEVLPRRGAIVAKLTRDDVIDHYELVGLVSGRAASIAASALDDAARAELAAIHARFENAPATELSGLNRDFHRIINRTAPARTRWLLGLLEKTVPSRYYEFADGWDAKAIGHHQLIIDAIVAKDADGARRAMEFHLHESGLAAAAAFEAMGFWQTEDE